MALVAFVFVCSTSSNAATMRFDNGGGDGLFDTADNWDSVDGTPNTVPTNTDIADISNSHTVSVFTTQPLTELQVAHPNGATSTNPGTATLNILPGANIQISSSNGFRVGRLVKAGQLAGSSKGIVNQTGGTVSINSGTNGLRLSAADSGIVADSYYRISGGTLQTVGTNNAIQVGASGNTFTSAVFHVVGSGITKIETEDFRMQGSASAPATLRFSLDSGGVTPIRATDEMRFGYHTGTTGSNNLLEIDLIDLAPTTDIRLIDADRLITNPSGGAEIFNGMPDGTIITASIGPPREQYTYKWALRYQDDPGDDGVVDAFIELEFIERTLSVPEPASCLLLVLGGVFMLFGRRRGC